MNEPQVHLEPPVRRDRPADAAQGSLDVGEPMVTVARVLIESPLPHLDRPFDYTIPPELDDDVVVGGRVKVRFAGRRLSGWVIERDEVDPLERKLAPILSVESSIPVLTEPTLQLARSVARRYAGTTWDVLRAAIPPRVAAVEKKLLAERSPEAAPEVDAESHVDGTSANGDATESATETHAYETAIATFGPHEHAEDFLRRLVGGEHPRAILDAAPGYGENAWPELLAASLAVCHERGRGAIAVVPDIRDLDRLHTALEKRLNREMFTRLDADAGPTPRYRDWLGVRFGHSNIVIGTRSAAWAPVKDLALLCCWDDGDDLYEEPRAPYQNTRDVLLLRASEQNTALLLAGSSRSTEAQRLIDTGWASPLTPTRNWKRSNAPRVISTTDNVEAQRDPLARSARLPQTAYRTAKDALLRGPVLVQVGRAGYAPILACQRCRHPARCLHCSGPLSITGRGRAPVCQWCGRTASEHRCAVCGSDQLRMSAKGALRTADELGRAFPQVPVISSSGDRIHASVPDEPALIISTPGAEPVAPGGYAAALLLDGDSMLERESLRAGEETVRRWFAAASLVRPATEGGVVVVTASESTAVSALVRWDPAGFAEREYALRRELQLPPAVRSIAVTGSPPSVADLLSHAQLDGSVRVIGPVPAPLEQRPDKQGSPASGMPQDRALVFANYRTAPAVVDSLAAARNRQWAAKVDHPAQLHVDSLDVV